jgi:sec-independent protein translocase protein TatA
MPALGPWELIIVLLIVVVIFGAGRLAEIGGALGKSVKEFRSATKSPEEEAAEAASNAKPVATVSTTTVSAPPAAATTTTDNTCPSCATVNPTGQVFCGQCGTRLTRAA